MLKIQQGVDISQSPSPLASHLSATVLSIKDGAPSDEIASSSGIATTPTDTNCALSGILINDWDAFYEAVDGSAAHTHAGISDEQCLQYFQARLGTVIKKGSEFWGCCPFHPDTHPSLSINLGKRMWYCQSACKTGGGMVGFEVKYASEKEQVVCNPNEARQRIAQVLGIKEFNCPKGPEAVYDYTDVSGELLYQVVRMQGKQFYQRSPNGTGGWALSTHGVKKVLYHLPDVVASPCVVIVEGEKDADNLTAALLGTHKDWAVTTSPMGSGKWLHQFSSYLHAKHVLVLPDNDDAGRKHANQIACSIHKPAASVKIVELPGLPEKGDVSDFLQTHAAAELFSFAQEAPFWNPALSVSDSAADNSHQKPKIITLASVTASVVDWLWQPYLPKGMLAMLSGDPGEGKTFIALAIAADLTVGRVPSTQHPRQPADVLYLTVENTPEHVLRPRFDSLNGDPSRFHILEGGIQLSDIVTLSYALKTTNAELLVVDPIQSFLGADVDSHRANQTRPILDDLARLAKEHGCCILLLRHLSKAPTTRGIYRGLGSIDFTGAVRTELLAGCSSKDPSLRALVHTKSNLGPKGLSLGYAIGAKGTFSWTGESDLTQIDLLSAESSGERRESIKEARAFLVEELSNKPRAVSELLEEASQLGIAKATLKRAKKELEIVSHKNGLGGGWEWSLPKVAQPHDTQIMVSFEKPQ